MLLAYKFNHNKGKLKNNQKESLWHKLKEIIKNFLII